MAIAYLSLGSNLGDRISNIQQAVSFLTNDSSIKVLKSSSFYETEPWGGVAKNWFANAVIRIETNLKPVELLKVVQNIEAKLGRNREKEIHWGERPLDIDILFYDNLVFQNEILVIPHKELHKRAFVLVPMLEIAENFVHPVSNKDIAQLYEELEDPEEIYLYGTVPRGLND
ncbi:2-amino-4-hydroxy-6-hydroxymethyldihydropteridine diphosphokinase [bacterium]|nr:2-amino-4-hydroxy-6-hydroxymethyldihydropteridine diphosphokinase [bacterium]